MRLKQKVFESGIIKYFNMFPSDPTGSLDDIIFKSPVWLKGNAGCLFFRKIYKLKTSLNISSLWTVSIFPGDLCGRRTFYFSHAFGGFL